MSERHGGSPALREYKQAGAAKFSLIERSASMPSNIFYIIGVVVVVLFILGYLGLR
ncbi:MAG: hypothetical protein ACREP3_01850 [Candidatus Binatia bacterium]